MLRRELLGYIIIIALANLGGEVHSAADDFSPSILIQRGKVGMAYVIL